MKEEKATGQRPDYRNDGVAVWVNETKEGEKYLSIQILGKNGIKVNAFKNEPKPEAKKEA